MNYKDKKSRNFYFYKLDKIVFKVLSNANSFIIILDTNIKNNIAISITHIHFCSNSIKKILHYTINIIMIEAELFAIRYRISQATQLSNIFYIIIITDSIHIARRIFDSSTYPYQLQSLKTLDHFSINTQTISLNFGIIQAIISSHFTYQLTIIQKSSTSILFISTRCCKTLARQKNTISISRIGK